MSLRSLILALPLLLAACVGQPDTGAERFPTSRDYPPEVMTRVTFKADGATPWRISALATPRATPAPWKIVVVTGTPSWSEYWAPTIAEAGPDREMIVADRPGFAESEPEAAVTDISAQSDALAAMLDGPPEQKVILLGQSYGGPIAALMAARHPEKVKALVLVSAFFGDRGPAINRLNISGSLVRPALPRDMKNALAELQHQKPQLPAAKAALASLKIPVIVLHGDADTFIPVEAARRLAAANHAQFQLAPGGDHFLNACCVADVMRAVDAGIAAAEGRTGEKPAAPIQSTP